MNQLIANVSSVPSARQLIALRTDLECVSAPRMNMARLLAQPANMRPRGVWFPMSQILSWTEQPNACILA
jgi:hypothetical protein